jgi:hypothetical protein
MSGEPPRRASKDRRDSTGARTARRGPPARTGRPGGANRRIGPLQATGSARILHTCVFALLVFAALILGQITPTGPPDAVAATTRTDTQRATAVAGEEPKREYVIKAAFLYNFAKFTIWPAEAFKSSDAPIDLCVLGKDRFGAALDRLESRSIRGRPVRVHRLRSLQATAFCHLLFVARSESPQLQDVLRAVAGRPVLTVADIPDFARQGGIINLTTPKERVRFEINVAQAREAGLRLSSKLLFLADIVSPAKDGGQ